MKKLMIVISVVLFIAANRIENASSKITGLTQTDEKTAVIKNAVMMRDGKVWLVKDGSKSLITSNVRMGGTKVDADGRVTLKDGSSSQLKEGDTVHPDGTIERATGNKQNNNNPKDEMEK